MIHFKVETANTKRPVERTYSLWRCPNAGQCFELCGTLPPVQTVPDQNCHIALFNVQIRSKVENESIQEDEQTNPSGDYITTPNEVHRDTRRTIGEDKSSTSEGSYGEDCAETALYSIIRTSLTRSGIAGRREWRIYVCVG